MHYDSPIDSSHNGDTTGKPEPAMTDNDPTAPARNVTERLLKLIADEVDAFTLAVHDAQHGQKGDTEATERRIDEAREKLIRNAIAEVDGVHVRTGFIDIRTARDAEARIIDHIDEADIRLRGPNRIRLECTRDGERFRVTRISAREYGRIANCAPRAVQASQADLYANTILDTYGAIRS